MCREKKQTNWKSIALRSKVQTRLSLEGLGVDLKERKPLIEGRINKEEEKGKALKELFLLSDLDLLIKKSKAMSYKNNY